MVDKDTYTIQWYAYRHVNGGIHLKRFWGDYGDIEEARSSDFVAEVYGPFDATSRLQAEEIANMNLGGEKE